MMKHVSDDPTTKNLIAPNYKQKREIKFGVGQTFQENVLSFIITWTSVNDVRIMSLTKNLSMSLY